MGFSTDCKNPVLRTGFSFYITPLHRGTFRVPKRGKQASEEVYENAGQKRGDERSLTNLEYLAAQDKRQRDGKRDAARVKGDLNAAEGLACLVRHALHASLAAAGALGGVLTGAAGFADGAGSAEGLTVSGAAV